MKTSFSIRGLLVVVAMLSTVLIAVACDSAATGNSPAMAAQTQPSPQTQTSLPVQSSLNYTPPTMIRKADFGSWHYAAQRMGNDNMKPDGGKQINPGDVFAKVGYSYESADGIRNYAAANRSQLQKVVVAGGQAEVWITFHSYLAPDQFRAWVKAHGLSRPWTLMRAINAASNDYITMGIQPDAGEIDPLPPQTLQFSMSSATSHGGVFKGIYFTRSWVDAKELPAFASDPNVYILDLTPSLVRMDLAAHGVQNTNQVDVEVEPNSPMWTMEHVGLDQFK